MDSQCVIYHWNSSIPTKLVNLGMPNGSSAEAIFERIDQRIGNGSVLTFNPINSPTVDLIITGGPNYALKANVNISAQAGNILEVLGDGIYIPDVRDWKVKAAAGDFPDYLDNKIVGDTDGVVSITSALDPGGHLVKLTPSLSLTNLAAKFMDVQDTSSIHLSYLTSSIPYTLSATSKISATAGNIITINSDGLYATSSGTITGANNGLSVSGGNTIQLGGPLIKNTSIDFATLYSLSFTGRPHIYLGDGSVASNATFQIDNTYQPNGRTIGGLVTTTGPLGANGLIGVNGNIIAQAGTDTDHSLKAGIYGQVFFNDGGTETLASFDEVAYTGTVGLVTMYGATTVSGSKIIAGVTGVNFAADTANATGVAALSAKALYQAPQGAAYSGTITNYYGLHIEDVGTAGLAAHTTHKYAIFQQGTTALNLFATAVTTSDARRKENIITFQKGLDTIDNLRVVEFNYLDNPDRKVGVIAQEVEPYLPEAVYTRPIDDINDFKLIESNVIFYTMLNAIKELSARVKALESK